MLATLSGSCSWLTRRDHLAFDPTIDDEIVIRSSQRDLDGKAFTLGEVDRLLAVSSRPQGGKVRSAWAASDVAIVSVLAYCGLRVSELVALTVVRSTPTTMYQCCSYVARKAANSALSHSQTTPLPLSTPTSPSKKCRLPRPLLAADQRALLFIRIDWAKGPVRPQAVLGRQYVRSVKLGSGDFSVDEVGHSGDRERDEPVLGRVDKAFVDEFGSDRSER